MTKTKKSATYFILIVVFLSLSSRLLGLARDTFILTSFGAGSIHGAYVIGIALTIGLFLGIGSGVSTTLVPIVVKYRDREDKPLFKIMLSLLLMIGLICLVYYFISPVVLRLYLQGSNEDMLVLTLAVMRRLLPAIVLVVMTYFFVAVLQGNEIFILPAAMGIPFNILFFLYLIFYKDDATVVGLAIVTTVAWILQFLMVSAKGITLIDFKITDFNLKSFYISLVPVTIVAMTHQLNLLIDTNRAGIFGDSGVSSINFGNMLFKALASTVVYGITAVMFPVFAEKLLSEKREGLNKSVVNVLRSVTLLLVPMAVGLIVLGKEFITLLVYWGKINMADVITTTEAFIGYTSFMLAFGIIEVLNKAYFSLSNRRVPIMITGIVTAINLVLSFLIIRFVGFMAIPFSTAIAYFLGAIFSLYIFLRNDKKSWRRLLTTMVKTFIATGIMAVVVYYTLYFTRLTNIKAIIFGALVGIVVYGISIIALKESLVIFNLKKVLSIVKK